MDNDDSSLSLSSYPEDLDQVGDDDNISVESNELKVIDSRPETNNNDIEEHEREAKASALTEQKERRIERENNLDVADSSMSNNNPDKSRYFDLLDEPLQRMLAPIEGYQSFPLVPLDQAVAAASEYVSDIDARVWVALENCKRPANQLSSDESGAIHLYTMEWTPSNRSLYAVLNRALRAENRGLLRPWFFYLKLLLTALYKLPSERRPLWRGIRADLSAFYPKGSRIVWWGFSSCTESIELLQSPQFLGMTGTRTLFNIECIHAKAIQKHSHFSGENELLLLPGTYLEVMGQLKPSNDLTIIHLRQIVPPHELIKPPFSIKKTPNASTTAPKSEPIHQNPVDLSDSRKFAVAALNAINKYRRWHKAMPLLYSDYLSKLAADQAQQFANTGFIKEKDFTNSTFAHDTATTGEQFADLLFSPLHNDYMDRWNGKYSHERHPEVNSYYLGEFGSASALLSKSRKQIGFGRAATVGSTAGVYIVAAYDNNGTENITEMDDAGWTEWEKYKEKPVEIKAPSKKSSMCTIL